MRRRQRRAETPTRVERGRCESKGGLERRRRTNNQVERIQSSSEQLLTSCRDDGEAGARNREEPTRPDGGYMGCYGSMLGVFCYAKGHPGKREKTRLSNAASPCKTAKEVQTALKSDGIEPGVGGPEAYASGCMRNEWDDGKHADFHGKWRSRKTCANHDYKMIGATGALTDSPARCQRGQQPARQRRHG